MFRRAVSDEAQKVVCEEVGSLGNTFVNDMADNVHDLLHSYLAHQLPPERNDVLHAENLLEGKMIQLNYNEIVHPISLALLYLSLSPNEIVSF